MTDFTELNLPNTINTSDHDLVEDFFVPVLSRAVQYDRGVGFFSSSWLRIVAKGMVTFAQNGGRARWITSPILSEADWEALQTGEAARTDPILHAGLKHNIDDLRASLEQDTLSALAWMIADGILAFKLALPHQKLRGGEFHDKFGVFADELGHQITFNGSYNESVQGTRNYESIKVFRSWEQGFISFVEDDQQRFEKLWHNRDENVQVFDLPEAAKAEILKLRELDRPYPEPEWVKLRTIRENNSLYQVNSPQIPNGITLRDYQTEAIDAWFNNDCQGLFEMATGTGKTITALAATTNLYKQTKRLVIIVSCPYKHLVTQWTDEAKNFGYNPIQVAESRRKWESYVVREVQAFQRKQKNLVMLITTNDALRNTLPLILEPVWNETLLIVDEAHHVGAPQLSAALPPKIPYRLGLSATPTRHYDEEGTTNLLNYFGEIVFRLALEDVIGVYLTPYKYFAIPVEITDEEFAEFAKLTRKIARLAHAKDEDLLEQAQWLAIKRSKILNNSVAKIAWLDENIEAYANIKHTLFYVGEQSFAEIRSLLGFEKRIRIHEFTGPESNKSRAEILQRFENGSLQALVAMRCLDEGVDVPPTRTAYFLASSGNPREFVQRRGRVLRCSEGKEYATIYDLIAIPPRSYITLIAKFEGLRFRP